MVNRIGGLASGMDIDSMVAKLMAAEKTPLNKLYQKKQTAEWQRDAYRSVNTKMKTFSDHTFDNLLLASNFRKKTPSITGTNSSKVTVNAGAGATGNLDIQAVKKLATNAKTGVATVSNTTHRLAKGADTLDKFGASASGSFKLSVTNASGTVEEKTISFDASDTIDTFIGNLKAAGLSKSAYDEKTGKFTIAGADYTIADADSAGELAKIGFLPSSKSLADTTTKDTKLSALGISAGDFKLDVGGTEKTFAIDAEDTIETFLTKLNAADSGVKATFDEKTKQFSIASTTVGQTVTAADDSTFVAFQKLGISSTAPVSSTQFVAAGAGAAPTGSTLLGELGLENGSVTFNVIQANGETKETKIAYSNTDTIDSLMKQLNTSGVGITALFSNGKLTIGANNSGAVKDSSTSGIQVINDGSANEFLNALGLKAAGDTATGAAKGVANTAFDLASTQGQDAEYTINGIEMKSNSNLINVSGYEITLNGEFSDSSVSVSSTNDISHMVDKIKEFVTKYNEFIGGINEQLKETKYRSYAPLTDEQRKEMSEHEQKLWDEKAKSGLLRSDSMLRQGLSDMRSALGGRVNGLGDNILDTMAEMGITTSSSYNDGGKLIIDETKLRKSLSDDPDRVINTLTQSGEKKADGTDTRGVIYRLRDTMSDLTKKIDAKAGRTTMTDSQYSIGKNLVDMDKRIDTWKLKLENIESRYWKQFTAMEKAISKANEQSSFFTTA
ncbi:flagellar filament capping protein FliD [Solibacillus sp. FSL H8-0538]|uniref:flagellar filament capping protein FliD n=1 Tax=Solibacillus sp. FSL H8-0538 TaxID=2921400 RepID=UPI0030F71302